MSIWEEQWDIIKLWMAPKNKVTDMGPKFTPRYWVNDRGYMCKSSAQRAARRLKKKA